MPTQNLKAALCAALVCTSAIASPDAGLPSSAVVLAARLMLPDGGLVDVESGYYLSPTQGEGVAKELAYLRGEKAALEASAAASMPSQFVIGALVVGVVVGVACGYGISRALQPQAHGIPQHR